MTKTLTKKANLIHYGQLLDEIKTRIRQGQMQAMWSANAELIATYWDVGRMICERQNKEGWGSGVLPRLAKDLHNDLSEVKGFSVRNLKLMAQFYKEYQQVIPIGQRAVAQLQIPPKGQLSVGHGAILRNVTNTFRFFIIFLVKYTLSEVFLNCSVSKMSELLRDRWVTASCTQTLSI